MDKGPYLERLEAALRHLMCAGLSDQVRRAQMGIAIEKFMREEAVKFNEEELNHTIGSTEEMVRIFIEYLINRGLVEVTDEPDH